MIQLNLTVEQALAMYALIGCVRIGQTGSRNINSIESMLVDSLPDDMRYKIWHDMLSLYCDEGIDVDGWDKSIDEVMKYFHSNGHHDR